MYGRMSPAPTMVELAFPVQKAAIVKRTNYKIGIQNPMIRKRVSTSPEMKRGRNSIIDEIKQEKTIRYRPNNQIGPSSNNLKKIASAYAEFEAPDQPTNGSSVHQVLNVMHNYDTSKNLPAKNMNENVFLSPTHRTASSFDFKNFNNPTAYKNTKHIPPVKLNYVTSAVQNNPMIQTSTKLKQPITKLNVQQKTPDIDIAESINYKRLMKPEPKKPQIEEEEIEEQCPPSMSGGDQITTDRTGDQITTNRSKISNISSISGVTADQITTDRTGDQITTNRSKISNVSSIIENISINNENLNLNNKQITAALNISDVSNETNKILSEDTAVFPHANNNSKNIFHVLDLSNGSNFDKSLHLDDSSYNNNHFYPDDENMFLDGDDINFENESFGSDSSRKNKKSGRLLKINIENSNFEEKLGFQTNDTQFAPSVNNDNNILSAQSSKSKKLPISARNNNNNNITVQDGKNFRKSTNNMNPGNNNATNQVQMPEDGVGVEMKGTKIENKNALIVPRKNKKNQNENNNNNPITTHKSGILENLNMTLRISTDVARNLTNEIEAVEQEDFSKQNENQNQELIQFQDRIREKILKFQERTQFNPNLRVDPQLLQPPLTFTKIRQLHAIIDELKRQKAQSKLENGNTMTTKEEIKQLLAGSTNNGNLSSRLTFDEKKSFLDEQHYKILKEIERKAEELAAGTPRVQAPPGGGLGLFKLGMDDDTSKRKKKRKAGSNPMITKKAGQKKPPVPLLKKLLDPETRSAKNQVLDSGPGSETFYGVQGIGKTPSPLSPSQWNASTP